MLFHVEQWDSTHLLIRLNKSVDSETFHYLKKWANEFAEKTFVKSEGGWSVPLTDTSLQHIAQFYVEGRDYTLSDTAKMMVQYKKMSTAVDQARSEKRWDYLYDGVETKFNYPSIRKPFEHQKVAVESMTDAAYFGLLMEMGTGKSKCIVDELAELLRNTDSPIRVIIVCPKSLRKNWVDEFYKNIAEIHNFQCAILDTVKGLSSMIDLVQSQAKLQIAIVSYDSVRGMMAELKCYAPHYLCLDESHYIKSPKSKRFKAIRELAPDIAMRRILTGTPVTNNILDLWTQFEILEPGILGYASFSGFKSEFCQLSTYSSSAGGREFEKIEGFQNLEKLKVAMARCSFIVRKEQCLKGENALPETLYETRRIEMPSNLRRIYDEFECNFSSQLTDGCTLKTDFIIAQMLKLSQLCCGFACSKRETRDADGIIIKSEDVTQIIEGGDAKLNQMLDDAEDICGSSKLIIWARFRLDIDAIVAGLNARGILAVGYDGRTDADVRDSHVTRFNSDPLLRVFVSNPGAGGTGLTLLGDQRDGFENHRCKNAFFYSSDFSFGKREQAEARCHRIGQRNPVLYRDYVYENTIEETIASNLQNKRDLADCVKDVRSIREMLKRKTE